MKTTLTKLATIALLAVGLTSSAMALSTSSAEYIGYINPNVPSNPASEVERINELITLALGDSVSFDGQTITRDGPYNGVTPMATLAGAIKDETGSTTVDVTGFEYLLGKYDAMGAGALVFYVGDLTGNQTLPGTFSGNALSHWSLYNATGSSVPDGGTTAALIGLGLVGMSFIARRKTSA